MEVVSVLLKTTFASLAKLKPQASKFVVVVAAAVCNRDNPRDSSKFEQIEKRAKRAKAFAKIN